MPLAVLEALARGLPVVGAAAVPREPTEFARGIRVAVSLTDELRSEHAQQAELRIESGFALDPWARRVVNLYETVLGRSEWPHPIHAHQTLDPAR